MNKFREKGFTLVELLIVIALIAILSVAVLATINPIEQANKANDSTTQNDAAEVIDGKSGWTFTHNPFSAAMPDDQTDWLAGKNIEKLEAAQYDLVCNGYEVGGGSIRAHTKEMLLATYKIMGYSEKEAQASIGHMLEAFTYGTPPHGGLALGLDRLMMVLAGENSVKEVVAFPTSGAGKTSIMDAPSAVETKQLDELNLKINHKN